MLRYVLYFFIFSYTYLQASECPCIKELTLDYFPKSAFTRISEYFTGCENKSGNTILRSHPECRQGMYFILHLNCSVCEIPQDAKVTFKYIAIGEVKEEVYSWDFSSDVRGSNNYLYIGLTGEDWYRKEKALQAWSIQIQDASGEILTEEKSYLWSK